MVFANDFYPFVRQGRGGSPVLMDCEADTRQTACFRPAFANDVGSLPFPEQEHGRPLVVAGIGTLSVIVFQQRDRRYTQAGD